MFSRAPLYNAYGLTPDLAGSLGFKAPLNGESEAPFGAGARTEAHRGYGVG